MEDIMEQNTEILLDKQDTGNMKVFISNWKTWFDFRKGEDFNKDIILACHTYQYSYVLQKTSENRFKVRTVYSLKNKNAKSRLTQYSIQAYVSGDVDFYWMEGTLYDTDNKPIFKLDFSIASLLTYQKSEGLPISHLKNDIYISSIMLKSVILLSPKKSVLFLPTKLDETQIDKPNELFIFDNIALKDFELTEGILQKLKHLETIDEMKELIQRELSMSVI